MKPLLILIPVALLFTIIGQFKKAEFIIAPIVGIMFGFLYHKEEYEKENEYTLQCLIGFFSLNVIWTSPHNG